MARYYYDNDTWNKSDAALPDKPLGDATSAVGEVMINSMEYYTPSGNQYRTIYVWNTKTGKSTRYYYDDSKWLKSDAVLPENPLETPSTSVGEMMMTHQEYYSPSGTQFRIMFVWNTKTGKAARYYYDNGKWEKSTAAFPETPLGLATSSVGEVMMKYIELYTPSGNQHRTVYVWNTKTGKMVRYYYENEKWEKSLPTIPVNPLGTATALVGEAMMNAMEYYTPSGNQHRTLYIWNTKTGLATRYYYDNEKWEKSTAALPDKPLE
jgi:WD40 repeat protein